MGEVSELIDFLKNLGLKVTRERVLILEEVYADHGHFSADDLFVRLRSKGVDLSRATVYRTLSMLVKAGLLSEIGLGERHAHYEHTFGHGHHDHLICLRCGEVIEFCSPDIEELQNRLCQKEGFEPAGHRLQIFGYCKKCKKK